jgi:carbamoylphosphate synthase large subunit
MKPRVLLATTSCWYPSARLTVALSRRGCGVEVVCPAQHPVRKSKSVLRVHEYSGLSPLASFARAITVAEPDFIVSGDDFATQHLHRLYAQEKRKGKLDSPICAVIERSLGNPESFSIVSARTAFMDAARKEGVRVPPTEVIRNAEELKAWIMRTGLPTVLKANGTSGGDGVRIAHTLAEANHSFEELQAPPLLARALKRTLVDQDTRLLWPSILRHRSVVNGQMFVVGQEATSTIVCWKGAVLASLHFQVVNKTSSTGHASVLRLIENGEMSAAVERMSRRLSLSGFYGFDFMLEVDTGNAHLIEVNPRSTQVGHLSLGVGRDLPSALYATLSGEPVQPSPKVTDKDTIALFPQEWIRDPESPFLRSAYHDVPWEESELIRDCVRNSRKQSGWYSRSKRKPASSNVLSPRPIAASAERNAVQLD